MGESRRRRNVKTETILIENSDKSALCKNQNEYKLKNIVHADIKFQVSMDEYIEKDINLYFSDFFW